MYGVIPATCILSIGSLLPEKMDTYPEKRVYNGAKTIRQCKCIRFHSKDKETVIPTLTVALNVDWRYPTQIFFNDKHRQNKNK